MSDQVTDALERLRNPIRKTFTPSDENCRRVLIDEYEDLLAIRDYALAATDERPLTREWLEAVLGRHQDGQGDYLTWYHDSRQGPWIDLSPKNGSDAVVGTPAPNRQCQSLVAPADAIAFFQIARWPVSRAKIVEAWRAL